MDAAEIERRVVARIRDVALRSPHQAAREHRFDFDFHLDGRGICRLGELIEEEFSINIRPADLVHLALYEPSVGGLCDLVEEALADV
jgi:acyl carrier protein